MLLSKEKYSVRKEPYPTVLYTDKRTCVVREVPQIDSGHKHHMFRHAVRHLTSGRQKTQRVDDVKNDWDKKQEAKHREGHSALIKKSTSLNHKITKFNL